MPQIVVDGRTYEVPEGRNLLHACLSLQLDLPFFCWHPAMGSVGACRQCVVKQFRDEQDTRGRLVVACMTPAADGTRISIRDREAADFRTQVVEWLMVNHPHDCPVCDEGGECHLQDMTWMTGHVYRRYRGEKRTYRNQYLGPFVNHEMNRCIQCYRCVRFYCDYAGGTDLNAFALRDFVYFGRSEDGVLESEFAGNLVEVCPTGVFTDKTLREHYARKWDLQTAPSVCQHCGVGCNTIPGERYGMLRRIRNRYHGDVNGYFLCDRGRYGYEFVNSDLRVRHPASTRHAAGPTGEMTGEQAVEYAASMLREAQGIVGIGSPRASLESNVALRSLAGEGRFCAGLSAADLALQQAMLDALRDGPARTPSLAGIGRADAVLVLGEDVSNTAPMMALALRQSTLRQPIHEIAQPLGIPLWHDHAVREAIQDARGPLFIATPAATRLDGIATEAIRAAPQDIARLGFAVAHALDEGAPEVPGLAPEERERAGRIAEALRAAEHPLVLSGPGLCNLDVVRAAAAVAAALHTAGRPAELAYAQPECNSMGLAMIGGGSIEDAARALEDGEADTLVVLENDLYRRAPQALVDWLFDTAKQVIAIDHLQRPTVRRAGLVLPAATFAEGDGTLVNHEGRAQRFFQVYAPDYEGGGVETRESWRWIAALFAALGDARAEDWATLDAAVESTARAVPTLAGIREAAPGADYRIAGAKVPRKPHRYSGRTAMYADRTVHEPKPPPDPDAPLSFSMEGQRTGTPPALIPIEWAPGWNSVQSLHRFQEEVAGPLRGGDPGVRLIEPGAARAASGSGPGVAIPDAFEARADEWLLVPLYHVFGSEELSSHSPPVAELAPSPYVALNPADAARLGASDGQAIEVTALDLGQAFPVRLDPSLPHGVAGLPVGLPGLEGVPLPAWTALRTAQTVEPRAPEGPGR